MRKLLSLFVLGCFFALGLQAQETFHVNGVHDERPELYAFTGVTLHVDYQTVIENATLLIKRGKVTQAGAGIKAPAGAVVIDLKGKHIYPSFIDLYSEYGIEPLKEDDGPWLGPQMETDKKGAFGWNEAIKPETNGAALFHADNKGAEDYRKNGFGTVVTHQNDGIARGTGALVSLANLSDNEAMLLGKVAAFYSFDKGVSSQDYPGSLMGVIALLRQTYLDAKWYAALNEKKEYNLSLEAWNKTQNLPQIFNVGDILGILRADKLGDEFGVQYIVVGNGDEYQKLSSLKATGATVIIPLDFPEAFDVEDPLDALNVSLSDMKHWELAPANAAFLNQNGIKFAITSGGLEDMSVFLGNLRKAVKYGLPENEALKALTITPAQLIKADKLVGSLKNGMLANFIITSGPLFDEESEILENWIQGRQYILSDPGADVAGTYDLKVGNDKYLLTVEGKSGEAKAKLKLNETDSTDIKGDIKFKQTLVTLTFKPTEDGEVLRLSGFVKGNTWSGKAELPGGKWANWSATFKSKPADEPEEDKADSNTVTVLPTTADIIYPFTAYGNSQLPKQQTVLIRNATVWTNTDQGILKNTDVLITGGKITTIGQNVAVKNADLVIDGTGKHLTCGIIDEHSHIAISAGVNEWTESSSAEVSIGDVINSEDINIYRQLSGGVTTVQLLHGSANPIGGQSAIIKLRWGFAPEDMKFAQAAPFIKFALGENVKQSNWGDYNIVRYPQTRMGVEQIFVNYFTRALEYNAAWTAYNGLSNKQKQGAVAPRRDLELETLLQILKGERFVTCHSYVQSEINMLMKVADQFDFTLNTFTHILEGYKVADKMKEHGANASTFSDWWAYKYEVIDAIPYNAAILTEVGVNTAINSDDAEMGRRLNQEAAKTVKYGGMSEEEAWKMVTLNPAKMLHIDKYVGSVANGKDADVVLWSDNPLSIYAKVEKTFVDGMLMYDVEQDKQRRDAIAKERDRLIQLMLTAKAGGEPTQKPVKKVQRLWHCDDL